VLSACGLTEKGSDRPTNEDCFAINEPLGLCVIADGMGGHNAGEVAARIAVDAVVEMVARRCARAAPGSVGVPGSRSASLSGDGLGPWPLGYDASLSPGGNLLRTAVLLANLQILESAIATAGCGGMATTIVAARVADGRLSVAHVGDSRLYLVANRQVRQMTTDDSWLMSVLANNPAITPQGTYSNSWLSRNWSSSRSRGKKMAAFRERVISVSMPALAASLSFQLDGGSTISMARRVSQ